MSTKRIGILTSGGDCPGLNAVIRGAVKACHQLGYDCVGFLKGYEGLHDPVQYVHLTPETTRGILNQGGTILGSTNKGRFAATVGVQDRVELDPKLVEGVKQTVDQLGIDGLICVGGDGSLSVAQQFHENGIPVVGVPKTIDNDLSATAFTFGFDSAIECATDALDRLHTTAASHERIMVLEVMGRHAGWIALHAGIAGGGDVILIPEIDWNFEHVCHKILHRESQGKKFTLVVVAEGAELPGGGLIGESRNGQQMKLGGLGRAVAEEIERRLHRETRLSVLGHLQRGGNPTTFDRVLATQFGAHAVRLVKENRFGEMICSRPPEMTSVPIIEAVNVIRRVDPNGPAVQAARALGISFGDRPADEIGQDVFDRLEPVSHFAGFADSHHHTPLLIEEPETVEEAFAEELPATAALESSLERALEEVVHEPAPEPAVEPSPVAEPVSEEPIAEPVAADDTGSEEDAAVEEVVESVLDMAAEADEAAHGEGALGVEEPAESPAEPEPVEQREPEMPETDEAVGEEWYDDDEDDAVEPEGVEPPQGEQIVEERADDQSEEVAAAPEVTEELAESDADKAADAESVNADDEVKTATPKPTEEPVAEAKKVETPVANDEPDDKVSETVLIGPASPEEPAKASETDDKLAQAQALLAAEIAGAAKASRDDVPEDTTLNAEAEQVDVLQLVEKKLAAASAEVAAAAEEEESVVSETPRPEAAVKPEPKPKAKVAAEALAAPADQPHEDELVAEARLALEAALTE